MRGAAVPVAWSTLVGETAGVQSRPEGSAQKDSLSRPSSDADSGQPSAEAPMPVPEVAVARVRRFCAGRVPPEALHQVRLEVEVDPSAITIVERRAPWRPEYGPEWSRFPIARLRWSASTKRWTLSWRDRNLRFHRYDGVDPSPWVEPLLEEVDLDPTYIFWG